MTTAMRFSTSATVVLNSLPVPLNANPWFQSGVSSWTPFGGTFAYSTDSHTGLGSGVLTPDGVTETARVECNRGTIVVGQTYPFSAWVKCSVSRTVSLSANWFTSAGVYMSTTNGPTVPVIANTWTQLTMTATAPVGSGLMSGNVLMAGTPLTSHLLTIDDAPLGIVPTINGYGYVRVAPIGEKWEIDRTFVMCSSRTNEALCRIYTNQIAPANVIDGTYSGSSGDTTDTHYYLEDGQALFVEWTGGDSGATATVTLSGWKSAPEGGFRAVH